MVVNESGWILEVFVNDRVARVTLVTLGFNSKASIKQS